MTPTTTNMSAGPNKPSILDLLDQHGGRYEPALRPLEEVFPVHVVNELQSNGHTQNFDTIYLYREASFAEVQKDLLVGASSWQTRERDARSKGTECGGTDCVGSSVKGEAEWLYQVVKKGGMPETRFRVLDSESEWRALRKFVVEGRGNGVVVWEARTYAEMQRRKAVLAQAQAEADGDGDGMIDLDFHNVCELGLSLEGLQTVDGGEEEVESEIARRRRLSGMSAVGAGEGVEDGGGGREGEDVEEGDVVL